MKTLKRYIMNVLVSLDQMGNAMTGGDPDETISSRAGKAHKKGKTWGKVMCKFLAWFDKGHCKKSIEEDEGGDGL
ncbi:hypothetical protein EPN95_04550 [Patescibacteria group bacterium]|nr:MAG: hypothetical protein EPN95_04550 [Patescibacteria group bacterium]